MTDPREVQFVAFLRSMIERKIGIYYAKTGYKCLSEW